MSAYLDFLAGRDQGSLADRFETAAGASAGLGLGEQADNDSPTTDVVRGGKPADDPSKANNGFSGFFSGLGAALNKVSEIELQRYAQQRLGGGAASTTTAQAQAQQQAREQAAAPSYMPWLIGGGALLAVLGIVYAIRR